MARRVISRTRCLSSCSAESTGSSTPSMEALMLWVIWSGQLRPLSNCPSSSLGKRAPMSRG